MDFFVKKIRTFSIVDNVSFIYLIIITVLSFFSLSRTPYQTEIIVLLLFLYIFLFSMAGLRHREGKNQTFKKLLMFIYPVFFIVVIFESFFMILPYFNTNRYDAVMAAIDLKLLGVNPTVWIEQFITPWLTEILYFSYSIYFPMPLIIVGWLYKKNMLREIAEIFLIFLLCYYIAYIIYFIVPVQGPRFYLADLQQTPLTGVLFSESIRNLINLMEPNKLDAFPSLHAAILLLTMLTAKRYNRLIYLIFLPISILITISLVYLRYHYVIDVIVGFVLALITWYAGGWIYGKYAQYFSFHFDRRKT
ncbi:MAG: phosphatase PAP2 family protein [Calditrichaceae bacterium]|nr:phosphatase PAP2 family protein [Calditrichaceae bacterium]MBN2709143.1 phosphatase PAP2 family protein [Calditrichaceae bacterium]RQV96099.1 MAG: phosphatase PAP2 family protein [Calditrichota bacterium]